MKQQLEQLKHDFWHAIWVVDSQESLKELESEYLGKKWKLKAILAGVKDLSIEDKKTIWVAANTLKNDFLEALASKAQEIENAYYNEIEDKEAIERLNKLSQQRVDIFKAHMVQSEKISSARLLLCTPQLDFGADVQSHISFER